MQVALKYDWWGEAVGNRYTKLNYLTIIFPISTMLRKFLISTYPFSIVATRGALLFFGAQGRRIQADQHTIYVSIRVYFLHVSYSQDSKHYRVVMKAISNKEQEEKGSLKSAQTLLLRHQDIVNLVKHPGHNVHCLRPTCLCYIASMFFSALCMQENNVDVILISTIPNYIPMYHTVNQSL